MIGKLLGALVGRSIDRRDGKGGIAGTVAGAAAGSALRRMGPLGWVLGGGYLAARYFRNRRRR